MEPTTIATFEQCTQGSLDGTVNFPEVVRRLQALGAESYHADLYRREKTYYLPNGDSHVVRFTAPAPDAAIGDAFSEEAVAAALKAVQGGKIDYVEFLRRIMAAGTVAYSVYVAGRCAIYVGRRGHFLVEKFPAAA